MAPFFGRKKLRSNVLVCYTPFRDRFVLSVCAKRRVSMLGVLHPTSGMPGYLEYGQDYLPPTAAPFMLYGGLQLYRLYPVEQMPASPHCMCDLGNLFVAISIAETDADDYERICSQVETGVEYSPVPLEPSEELDINGSTLILQHAFCRWMRGTEERR